MKRKAITFSAIVAVFILLAFWLVPVVMADDPIVTRPHNWTDKQTFRSDVTVNSPTSTNKAAIVFGSNSTFSNAGAGTYTAEQTFNDGVLLNDEFVIETYSYASTSGTTLTWVIANGNVLFLSGTTPILANLPTITAAMDGYVLYVKNVSGATTRTLTPTAGTDAIESGKGSASTTDTTLDAVGEYRVWVADYTSGASGVWRLIDDGTNSMNDVVIGGTTPVAGTFTTLAATGAATFSTTADHAGAIYQAIITPTFVAGTGFTITGTEGNIFLINTTVNSGNCGGPGPGDGTGNTVVLPVPTAALDGAEFTIIKSDTGATDIFLYVVGGVATVDQASKTTDCLSIDAQGDAVTVIADYLSAVSYWIKTSRIH